MSCFTVYLSDANETHKSATSLGNDLVFADLLSRLKQAGSNSEAIEETTEFDFGGDDINFDVDDDDSFSEFKEPEPRGQVWDVNCPSGHVCKMTKSHKNGRKNAHGRYIKRRRIACDVCETTMDKCHEFYSCIGCDFDVCHNCAGKIGKEKMEVHCPKKHLCKHHGRGVIGRVDKCGQIVHIGNLICDGKGCDKLIRDSNADFWSCGRCDFDLCQDCAMKEAKKENIKAVKIVEPFEIGAFVNTLKQEKEEKVKNTTETVPIVEPFEYGAFTMNRTMKLEKQKNICEYNPNWFPHPDLKR